MRKQIATMTRPFYTSQKDEVAIHRMVELTAEAFGHLSPRAALEQAARIHATDWRWIIVGPDTAPRLMLLGKR